jgi:O-antigen ligase
LISLFSGVTSFDPGTSVPIALLSSAMMFPAVLVPACLGGRGDAGKLSFVLITASVGAGLIGLYQFFMKIVDTTWVDVDLFGDIPFRAYSTFGNPNVYGIYLLLIIPICAATVFYAKKPLMKLYALGSAGLLLVNLLLSYSRGCMLALALSALIFVLLTEKRLIALLPPAGAALFFVLPQTIINRLLSITNFSDTSTSFRIYIWQGTIRMLKDFWAVGIGQGGEAFNKIYPVYAFNAIIAPHAHNIYLQTFVETGITGLFAFLGICACFFREMASARRKAADNRDRILISGVIAAVAGVLFMGIFDHVFYNYRVMLTFFTVLGFGAAFARTVVKTDIVKTNGQN